MTDRVDDYYDKEHADRLIAEEKTCIDATRARNGRSDWYGVALSGGGIRSAIFSLGALQALAANNVMPSFDYMSSVSGGGYIASALQWIWNRDVTSGTRAGSFPFGATKEYRCGNTTKDKRLAYLRTHGQYLIPDERLSIWSLTAVIIRTLFLNLTVWLPAGAFAYAVVITLSRFLEYIPHVDKLPNLLSFAMASRWGNDCVGDPLALCKGAADTATAAASASRIPGGEQICTAATKVAAGAMEPSCAWPLELFFELCLIVGLLWIAGFAIWAIAFSLDTRISPKQDEHPRQWPRIACLAVSVLSLLSFVGLVIMARSMGLDLFGQDSFALAGMLLPLVVMLLSGVLFWLQWRGRSASASYTWRRTFEIKAGWALPWITIVIALATVPVIPYLLINKVGFAAKAAATFASLASGLYAAVFGHQAQNDQSAPGDLSRWVLMVASAIFIYSIAVVAYCIAQLWFEPGVLFASGDNLPGKNLIRAGIMVWVVVALVLMWFTNINYVGLHRFYRDRLMEAFMPAAEAVDNNRVDYSSTANRLPLTDFWPPSNPTQLRDIPYPIVNANAILMNDPDRLVSWRGGDNFILSPLFVGSSATGWERTYRYIAKNGPLTLPSAMAASGAAINANAAYVGAGVTRDRLVSIVLTLLNLRLGMWVARPDELQTTRVQRDPNHWSPGLRYGLTRTGYRSDSSFIELTDGGHFDNSGIYELARRKCSVIVAIDGEEDPSMALPALYSVAQRIREDFAAEIDLRGALDDLIPEKGKGYPEGVSFVTRPYFVAPIVYKDNNSKGVLIYVKLSLAQGLGFDALGYRAQHADFPHQPTADQFFVPEQVEAYRSVGFLNMATAIKELALDGDAIDAGSGVINIDRVISNYQNRPKPPPEPIDRSSA